MQVTTETFGNVLVVHTPEELTEDTVRQFQDALENHLGQGSSQVVLQMDRSELIDSAGLTAVVDLRESTQALGGNVRICALTDTGRRNFHVTRLDQMFDLYDSVIDAVSSFH